MASERNSDTIIRARSPALSVKLSPDGRELYAGYADGNLVVRRLASFKRITTMKHANSVKCLSISPSGEFLIAVVPNSGIYSWNVFKKDLLSISKNTIDQVVAHPKNNTFFGVNGSNELHIGDMRTGRTTPYLKDADFKYIALSKDGQYLSACHWNSFVVSFWRLDAKKKLLAFSGHQNPVDCIAFHDKRHQIISGSRDKTVRLWDIKRNVESHRFTISQDARCLAVSPDGRYLAAGCGMVSKSARVNEQSGVLYVWDLDSNKVVTEHSVKGHLVNSLVFGPQGKQLIAGTSHGIEIVRLRPKK